MRKSAIGVWDAHARWKCDTGSSLIAEAMTPGPGKLGTLHGVIYVCPVHRAAAEEQIGRAGYGPEVRDAPPGHKWDPWPCGHVTAYNEKALAGLSTLEQMAVTRNEDGSHSPAYDVTWPERLQVEWKAGCVALGTGLRIDVKPASAIRTGVRAEGSEDAHEEYYVTVRSGRTLTGGSKYTAEGVYAFLDGLKAAVVTTEAPEGGELRAQLEELKHLLDHPEGSVEVSEVFRRLKG